jgi:hypothetical protein
MPGDELTWGQLVFLIMLALFVLLGLGPCMYKVGENAKQRKWVEKTATELYLKSGGNMEDHIQKATEAYKKLKEQKWIN